MRAKPEILLIITWDDTDLADRCINIGNYTDEISVTGDNPITWGSPSPPNNPITEAPGFESNFPNWLNATPNGRILNLSGTPTGAGTYVFLAWVKDASMGNPVSRQFTFTIYPLSVGGSISGGSTPICEGSGTGNMTLNGNTGNNLTWQKQLNGGGWTDAGNTSTTYSETLSSGGTWDYRVEVQSGTCPVAYSTIQTIKVDTIPDASGTLNNTNTICNNGTCNITLKSTVNSTIFNYTVTSTPATGYNWTASKDPVAGSITDSDADGSETLSRQLEHDHNAPVTVTYTITPIGPRTTACTGSPITRDVVVNPPGQVNDPIDQVVCNGASTTTVTFTTANTGGTTTYAWTNDNTTIGLSDNGSGNIGSFTAVNTGTSPVVANIEVTPTFSNGGVNCEGTPKTFKITVNPSGQVNDPIDQELCTGVNIMPVNFSTNNTGGTTSYSWTNNNTSIGLAANGSGNIGSFIAVNTGTTPQVANISVTPTFSNGGVDCAGSAKSFSITVNPIPATPSSTAIDLMLVLDISGSMGLRADPGNPSDTDTKLEKLQEAVHTFLATYMDYVECDDRVGLVYFEDNVDNSQSSLVYLPPNVNDIVTDVYGKTDGGWTAMGGGLQVAIDTLLDNVIGHRQNIILVTDGEQNVNPMVNPVSLIIENIIPPPIGGNSTTNPHGRQIREEDQIEIYTIGINAYNPYDQLLENIANTTGGVPYLEPTDNSYVFASYLTQSFIEMLRDASPQLVDYRFNTMNSSEQIEVFNVERGIDHLLLRVNGNDNISELGFSVEKENINLTECCGRLIQEDHFYIYSIDLPVTVN
ncbi:MAG: hypothetical protein AMS27_04030, partial [Bacteroides sp. SM23_62_1]